MKARLHRLLRRKHSGTYHLWDRDPNAPLPPGTIFHKCTCVRCGYALDAVQAQAAFAVVHMRVPGRVADPDERRTPPRDHDDSDNGIQRARELS